MCSYILSAQSVNDIYNHKDSITEISIADINEIKCDPQRLLPEQFEENGMVYVVLTHDSTSVQIESCNINIGYKADEKEKTLFISSSVKHNDKEYKVYSIGIHAFRGNTCENIVIEEGIKSIQSYAFCDSYNMKSIIIPASVEDINIGIFLNCPNLTSIKVSSNNPIFDSRDRCNAIIHTMSNTLLAGCVATIIPSSVHIIGKNAFSGCMSLKQIIIPEGVQTLESCSFDDCANLKDLSLPQSLQTIHGRAFFGCIALDSLYIPREVSKIEKEAFSYCRGLHRIVVDKENPVYDSREDCNAIIQTSTNAILAGSTHSYIPKSVRIICDGCLYGSGITHVFIPENVDSIEIASFADCKSLISIEVDTNNKTYDSRHNCNAIIQSKENKLIVGCNTTVFPNDVKAIGSMAMYRVSTPKYLNLPDGLETIEWMAFAECNDLESVIIPASVKVMESSIFSNCLKLNTVRFACPLRNIPRLCFYECENLEMVEIAYGTSEIGMQAFRYCNKLKHFSIPSTINTIHWKAFEGCPCEENVMKRFKNK